jgi:hypothetical protein
VKGNAIYQHDVDGSGGVVTLKFQEDEGDTGVATVLAEFRGIVEPIARLSYRSQCAHVRCPVIILEVFACSEGRRGEVTDTILVQPPRQEGDEPTFCVECDNKGWSIFNDNEIERCDACKRFDSDTDAVAHVMKQLEQVK